MKAVIKSCISCQRINARAFDEEPAALPGERLNEAYPFEIVGIDIAGPLRYYKEEELKKEVKRKREEGRRSSDDVRAATNPKKVKQEIRVRERSNRRFQVIRCML